MENVLWTKNLVVFEAASGPAGEEKVARLVQSRVVNQSSHR
jgi:hypothetical protein